MSAHFISGKPGGGKTLFAVRQILAELRGGGRRIVTNVPLKLGELNAYLQREGIDLGEEHIAERVTMISEEQLREFYRYRGGGVVLPVGKDDKVEYSGVVGGVFYVLDEVHIAFNSRAWAETGRAVIYYLSQHRKLGDDILLITQAVMNVDKQMRSMAQDFTYIRNFKKERAGLFRLPGVFMRRTFLEPATPTSKATESGTFTLDVTGIAACYDTAAGVGIIGRSGADTREKSRGLHWAILPAVVVLVVFGVIHYAPVAVLWVVGGGTKKAVPVVRAAERPLAQALPAGASTNVAPASVFVVTNEAPARWCSAIMYLNHDLQVWMNDGERFYVSQGRVQMVTDSYVIVEGKRYPIGRPALAGR